MTSLRKNPITCTLFVCIIVWCISGYAQQSGRSCVIKNVIGDVKVQRFQSTKWIPARPNMPLKENDAVRTFVESEAIIETSEGSQISLKENTTLELSAFSATREGATQTGIKILSGDLMANVKKLVNTQSKFNFETPTAVAAIRGTKVGFEVDNAKTDVKVYEGTVYVVPKGAKKGSEVKANEMTSVEKGQKQIVVIKMTEPEIREKRVLPTTTDTTNVEKVDTTSSNTAPVDTAAKEAPLTLKVTTPENGLAVMPQGQVVVSGKVTPVTASVRVRGSGVKVAANGDFKAVVNTPVEEGEFNIDIEATYGSQSKSLVRVVVVKAPVSVLSLSVTEPANGLVVSKPLIRVAGITTPGAEVTVSGLKVPVGPNGSFTRDLPIPDEDGEVVVEIEATLKDNTKHESRTVRYKAPAAETELIVQMPADRMIVCSNIIEIKGSVKPAAIQSVTVNGKSFPVRNGIFSGQLSLPNDPGENEIEFEVSSESTSKTVKRTVLYKPTEKVCNMDVPYVQPSSLPVSSKTRRLYFTVFDKTPFDEIVFNTMINGSRDAQSGPAGSRFYLDLEEGVRTYEVYAQDLAGNKSSKITGTISFLSKEPLIQLNDPSSPFKTIYIPPSRPNGGFAPEYTIDFSVENLPDDNPKLLKEIRVLNKTNGDVRSIKTFYTDIDFDADIKLKKGQNQIMIEVRDVNDKLITKDLVIEVR